MDAPARIVDVALNGARTDGEHPRIPRQPAELATAASAAVAAGARVLHLHPCDASGAQTLDAGPCAAAIEAVRAACPGAPISLSTSAAIEPDPARRRELVAEWTVLPDLVTANQGEDGIVELCEALLARGVGIEAGLLAWPDAEAFVASGLAGRCARVLLEPLDAEPDAATRHAARMEDILRRAQIVLEQVHHGEGIASWSVNRRAVERGRAIRTGLEDTTVLPDGRLATDNAELVRVAVALP
ncbi:MAG: hypothetical protein QOG15_1863 [Solirubrobacteraceae bacterium]|nr:hypothetical protein [Solirubrobacteraceae bacterium]